MAYCPECRKFYEPGVVLCRDCRTSLTESLPPDPFLGDDAESGALVVLREVPDATTGAMWQGALESQGLHAVVHSNALPAYGQVLRDWSTQSWGALMVTRAEYGEARAVLEDFLATAATSAPAEDEDPESTA